MKAVDSVPRRRAAVTSPSEPPVAARLAQELNASWGWRPDPYTAASLTAQRAEHGWSWGEVLIANRLAQQVARGLMTSNPRLTPPQALAKAADQMTASWRHGVGWGALALASGARAEALVGGMAPAAPSAPGAADHPTTGEAALSGGGR